MKFKTSKPVEVEKDIVAKILPAWLVKYATTGKVPEPKGEPGLILGAIQALIHVWQKMDLWHYPIAFEIDHRVISSELFCPEGLEFVPNAEKLQHNARLVKAKERREIALKLWDSIRERISNLPEKDFRTLVKLLVMDDSVQVVFVHTAELNHTDHMGQVHDKWVEMQIFEDGYMEGYLYKQVRK